MCDVMVTHRNPTQAMKVLDYMIDQGSITQAEALKHLGIARLAARIHELKKKGHDIESEIIEVANREGKLCHVAKYYLTLLND